MNTWWRLTDGHRSVVFFGTLLAEASTRRPEADRWSEFRIFRRADGTWIVTGAGRSIRRNEVDRIWMRTVETPEQVVRVLERRRADNPAIRYLTTTVRSMLHAAADVDPALRVVLAA